LPEQRLALSLVDMAASIFTNPSNHPDRPHCDTLSTTVTHVLITQTFQLVNLSLVYLCEADTLLLHMGSSEH
jgi:hypothetical protein